MIKAIVVSCYVFVLTFVSMVAWDMYAYEKALRAKEGKCIATFIRMGIPRKDITVTHGECYVMRQVTHGKN